MAENVVLSDNDLLAWLRKDNGMAKFAEKFRNHQIDDRYSNVWKHRSTAKYNDAAAKPKTNDLSSGDLNNGKNCFDSENSLSADGGLKRLDSVCSGDSMLVNVPQNSPVQKEKIAQIEFAENSSENVSFTQAAPLTLSPLLPLPEPSPKSQMDFDSDSSSTNVKFSSTVRSDSISTQNDDCQQEFTSNNGEEPETVQSASRLTVSVSDLRVNDRVILRFDQKLQLFVVFTLTRDVFYIVSGTSIDVLRLKKDDLTVGVLKKLNHCLIKKYPNGFNFPIGTIFYFVDVEPDDFRSHFDA